MFKPFSLLGIFAAGVAQVLGIHRWPRMATSRGAQSGVRRTARARASA